LCQCADRDESLWLLTADLGYSVLERFATRFPARFLNVGVAEQNMVGIAAGLALSRKRVVIYSIVNFATLRCLEQIRNDIAYHDLPVTIAGVGGGFAYGSQGYTHHGLEDLAVMSSLGTVDVVAPADAAEARAVVRTLSSHSRPAYVRLGKAGEAAVHETVPEMQRGTLLRLRDGKAALLVATGELVAEAMLAARMLAQEGTEVAVWSAPWLNPFDAASIARAVQEYGLILTAEEGVTTGGLGAAVARVAAEQVGPRAQVIAAGVPGDQKHHVVSQPAARAMFKLDGAGLAARLRAAMGREAKG